MWRIEAYFLPTLSRIFILLAVAFSVFTGDAQSQVTCPHTSNTTQKDILLKLYCNTDGDKWTNKSGWGTSQTLSSSWHGVTVSSNNVTHLELEQNNLNGTILTELGSLTNLEVLYLHRNKLSGTIPADLGNLTNLREFYLYANPLSGNIPAELGNLTNLRELSLNTSRLSGTIPADLGNLTNLQRLYLQENDLSGTIPADLGSLATLEKLDFHQNKLSGTIPADLGNLTNLEVLFLQNNQLSGTIPTDLGSLTALNSLLLRNNQLSGTIPTDLGSLTALNSLLLHLNELSGTIPSELGSLANLQRLQLHENELSGTIPSELGSLANLQLLDLYSNLLSGAIPSELGDLTNLQRLALDRNQLSGAIPSELGDLTKLTQMWLDRNQLSGTIPSELGSLANLQRLILYENQMLHGTLPLSLMDLQHLRILSIEDTQACAPGDEAFQRWLRTITFTGSNCESSPPPPPPPEDLEELREFYQATDGENWKNSTNWPSSQPLSQWFGISVNSDGRVTGLDLSDNDLSGEIPDSLADLSDLETLDLSDNPLLGGELPLVLTDLGNLETLNIGNTGVCAPRDTAFQRWLGMLTSFSGVDCASPEELDELTKLYEATDGDNWTNNTNWLSEELLTRWHGISANNDGHVTELNLAGNGLSGELPVSLMNLGQLTTLNIDNTQACAPRDAAFQRWLGMITFTGNNCAFSEELDELRKLYEATDGDNWVNNTNWLNLGPLSLWHGVTTDGNGRVTGLDLSDNGLSGELPVSLMNLGQLTTLNIDNTQACAPLDAAFQRWLSTITFTGVDCASLPPPSEDLEELEEVPEEEVPEEEVPEEEVPEQLEEKVPETGGGCAIASDGYEGNAPKSSVFNLLAVVCAMFFTASLKKRQPIRYAIFVYTKGSFAGESQNLRLKSYSDLREVLRKAPGGCQNTQYKRKGWRNKPVASRTRRMCLSD